MHLKDSRFYELARGKDKAGSKEQLHLSRDCVECREKLYSAFDRVLQEIEKKSEKRSLKEIIYAARELHSGGYLCPQNILMDLEQENPRALRHYNACFNCAMEVGRVIEEVPSTKLCGELKRIKREMEQI